MAYMNLTQLVDATTRRLRQVPGLQTQLYADTVLASYLQEAYEILREEAWWPWLMKRIENISIGVDGLPTTSLKSQGLMSFGDIRAVYMGNYQDRLPMLGEDVNTVALSPAAHARYVEPTSVHNDPTQDKVIKLHGVSGSVIHLWARCDPTGVFTTPSVAVPMNQWLLINYTMWRYMTDDAANPGAAAAALQAYDKLREQEISRVNNMPVWFNSGDPYANSEWQER